MKQPIKPEDIRKGDLIRVERDGDNASEYRAYMNSQTSGWGRYYLLDRPTPPVELPEQGLHLGWLTHDGHTDLLMFNFWANRSRIEDASYGSITRESVEGWVPAVAVPKSALDEWRAFHNPRGAKHDRGCRGCRFLAAVDEANGGDS